MRGPETLITTSKVTTIGKHPCISYDPCDGRCGGFHLFSVGRVRHVAPEGSPSGGGVGWEYLCSEDGL